MRRSFIIVLLLCLMLGSCTQNRASCEDILKETMQTAQDLPDGKIYISGAEEGSQDHLSSKLMCTMYGENADQRFESVADYAIYISSFAAPCEIGIFRCYSSTDARLIEEMCRSRIDELRVALHATEFEEFCENAVTEIRGRYVVTVMAKDAEALKTEALRQID